MASLARASTHRGLRVAPKQTSLRLQRTQHFQHQAKSIRPARSARLQIRAYVPVAEEGYKVIARAEIPALIPRDDFIDQIARWSFTEFEENGRQKYGMKMNVTAEPDENGEETSFAIKLKSPEGEEVEVQCCMDDEEMTVEKSPAASGGFVVEVGEGSTPTGELSTMKGKTFFIRRKEGPLSDNLRPTLASVLAAVSKAVNIYYAFGTVYADDAT